VYVHVSLPPRFLSRASPPARACARAHAHFFFISPSLPSSLSSPSHFKNSFVRSFHPPWLPEYCHTCIEHLACWALVPFVLSLHLSLSCSFSLSVSLSVCVFFSFSRTALAQFDVSFHRLSCPLFVPSSKPSFFMFACTCILSHALSPQSSTLSISTPTLSPSLSVYLSPQYCSSRSLHLFVTWRIRMSDTSHSYAGRRIKFAPGKSLDSPNFSSEFSVLGTFPSNVSVNPVISWNGHNSFQRIFPSNSRYFTTLQARGLLLSRFFSRKEPFKCF